METMQAQYTNPLSDLISDDVFEVLSAEGLLNEKIIRDYLIRKKFKQLRSGKVRVEDAISTIQEDYLYLQLDTIRKIVYGFYQAKKPFQRI